MNKYIINGRKVKDIDTLCREFAFAVDAPDGYFGKCFQSFDDCLFGGYGLESPCQIIWQYSEVSKNSMDSKMLARACEDTLKNSLYIHQEKHEEGKAYCVSMLAKAKCGERSYFDEIVDTIKSVPDRAGFDHKVELILE